jgi:subtilisin family serine protease
LFTLSGTSIAAPNVTGVAAMLIDQNPAITPDQVKGKLMKTAWRGFPANMSTTVTDPSIGAQVTDSATHDIRTPFGVPTRSGDSIPSGDRTPSGFQRDLGKQRDVGKQRDLGFLYAVRRPRVNCNQGEN